MMSNITRDEIVQQANEIIDIWLEYDATGDVSVFTQADVFAEDIVHNPSGDPPIEGKDAVIEYLDSLDPTVMEWELTLDEITIGRELVVAQMTFRGTEKAAEDGDPEQVVGTSVDAFRRQDDGSLTQILSSPNPDE